ncbi:MAG: fumarate hydratase, partial [Oscillospiraceae bacterium]|nr:fumarate hydratase [Oscillospiraceae bacterium]
MAATISRELLKNEIKKVLVRSLTEVPDDVIKALREARAAERNPRGQKNLDILIENAETAAKTGGVICQDTGVPVFFVKTSLGFPFDGDLREVFDEAVREVTAEFPLRSMIAHPVTRYDRCDNTGKNIPLLHFEIENGLDYLEIESCPKGAGSGTWAQTRIFAPSEGMEAVKKFVVEAVLRAGSNPCPPFIVGVGLGGPIEEVARLATAGSFRRVDVRNEEPVIAELEQ